MYSLVAVLSVLACASFVLAFVHGRRRHLWLLGLWCVLLLYAHNWALFLLAGMGVAWLWLWHEGRVGAPRRRAAGRGGRAALRAVGPEPRSSRPPTRRRRGPRGPRRCSLLGIPGVLFGSWPCRCWRWPPAPRCGAAGRPRARGCWRWSAPSPPRSPSSARSSSRRGRRATSPSCSGRCCWRSPRCWRGARAGRGWRSPAWWRSGSSPGRRRPRATCARWRRTVAPALRPGDLVVSTQPEQVPVLSRYLPGGVRYLTPLGHGRRAAGDGLARRRGAAARRDGGAGARAAGGPAPARPPHAAGHARSPAPVAGAVEPRGAEPHARVARLAAGEPAPAPARPRAALDLAAAAERACGRSCSRHCRGESTACCSSATASRPGTPSTACRARPTRRCRSSGASRPRRWRRSSTGSPTAGCPPTSRARSRPPS